jgi:hypothetical protein
MTAVLLALATAAVFAAATVAEHRGATDAAGEPDGGLVRRLLRQRVWLAGQVGAGAGVLLQALALRAGRLVVVQPLLSSGLVLALVFGVLVDRRHPDRPLPDRVQWAAAVAVAVGLSLFLLAARPGTGAATAPLWMTTLCATGALAAAGAAALYGRDPRRRHRAFGYGTAVGLGYGVAGLLLKQLVGSSFGHGAAWATLAEFAAVGGVAVLLSQWGFQAGPLVESLPVATVLEPLVAVALAGPLFAEHLAAGALAGSGQVLGGLTLVGGVLVLAWRTARREQTAVAPADRPSADRRVYVPAHRPPRPATATPLTDRRRTT